VLPAAPLVARSGGAVALNVTALFAVGGRDATGALSAVSLGYAPNRCREGRNTRVPSSTALTEPPARRTAPGCLVLNTKDHTDSLTEILLFGGARR